MDQKNKEMTAPESTGGEIEKAAAPDLPEAVIAAQKKGVEGLVLNDPFDENEHFYFRKPTKADLSYYIKVAGLQSKPKAGMEWLACACAIHPDAEALKERFREAPALASSFQEAFMKSLGGGRFLTWKEIKGADLDGRPEKVRETLSGENKGRVIRVADDFENLEEFYFRRPGAKDQESFQTTAGNRQKPLSAMEQMIRDCAIEPDGKAMVQRIAREPALAMEIYEQLNKAMGGGRGFDAQDF